MTWVIPAITCWFSSSLCQRLPERKPPFSYGFPMVFLWFAHSPIGFPSFCANLDQVPKSWPASMSPRFGKEIGVRGVGQPQHLIHGESWWVNHIVHSRTHRPRSMAWQKHGKIFTGNQPDFPMKIMGFSCNFSPKPINWLECPNSEWVMIGMNGIQWH